MRRPACIVIAAAVMSATFASPASATGFHAYSTAYESSLGAHYTGNALTRTETAISIPTPAGGSCTTGLTLPVVFEPTWLVNSVAAGAEDWIEVGTAYTCNNVRYHYGYTCQNGSCYHPPDVQLVNGSTLRFSLVHQSDGNYHGLAGSDQLFLDWHSAEKFTFAQAGLESYWAGNVRKNTASSMAYSVDFNAAGLAWAGFDATGVGSSSPAMCGGWDTASQWRFSEGVAC
jgi:hypothetical protein